MDVSVKKKQEKKEQKGKEKAEACLYTIIKVARDEDLSEQIGKEIYFDLVDHDKVRTFHIQKQMPFTKLKEEVAEAFGIPVKFQRYWLWAKRKNHTYRPDRALTAQEEIQLVGELREVSNKWNNDELKLFLEVGFCLDLRPLSLLGKTTKEEILLFLKLYDPQKEKIRYVGRLFVKGSGKPLEVIPKLKELVGFSPDEEIDLFEEIKFEPSVMFENIDCMLSFRDCELEDGDIVCYQKSLRNQCNEQYRFPDVPSYLEYVHNRQPEEHKVSDRTFDFPTETPQSTEVAPVNAKSELDDPGRSYLMDNTSIIEVVDVVPKVNDYVGLKNQGATCYLNSLLQTLYHIPSFRKAVYHMPTTENDNTSGNILLTLQSLFYKLQYNDTSVETKELTKSLGWDPNDSFIQHDVQEFNRVLCEKLEDKMKGTVVDGTIQQFLEGHHMSCTKCINVDFKSTKKGSFYDLQLDMKECCDVYDSFDKYVEVERLEDDNKYDAEQHGLQDALKSVLFIDFPPVLQLQLKRFKYDSVRDAPIKINDRYEFPLQLDLDRENGKYLSPDADRSVKNLYTLHSVLVHRGGVHGGHYYAYIRPTLSDQWYKFDDEFVTKEDRKRALDEGYGSDTKDSNAYLLVYIRESDKEKIICNVDEKDMAEHLRTRLKKEQEEKEQKRKEKAIIKAEEHKVSDPTSDFLIETSQPIEDTENTVVAHAVDHSAPVRFRWPINNFSRLNVKELYSDAFNAGGYSWRILIFPKGNNTDCLSMYLEVADAATLARGWSRCAEFSLAVVNHIHHKLTVKIDTKHQFNANKSDWGFTSYMPLTELIDPGKGYLMDDKVIIEAEVVVPKVIDCSKLIV